MNKHLGYGLIIWGLSIGLLLASGNQVEAQDQRRIESPGLDTYCAVLEERIESRIEIFEVRQDDYRENYERAANRIRSVLDDLDAQGYDITEVEGLLQENHQLWIEFSDSVNVVVEGLRESQELPCGRSEGAFAQKMADVAVDANTARSNAQKIRDHYFNNIRPALERMLQAE